MQIFALAKLVTENFVINLNGRWTDLVLCVKKNMLIWKRDGEKMKESNHIDYGKGWKSQHPYTEKGEQHNVSFGIFFRADFRQRSVVHWKIKDKTQSMKKRNVSFWLGVCVYIVSLPPPNIFVFQCAEYETNIENKNENLFFTAAIWKEISRFQCKKNNHIFHWMWNKNRICFV